MKFTLDDIKNSKVAGLNTMIGKPKLIAGIDPGIKTGLAIWDRKRKGFDKIYSSGIIIVQSYLRGFMIDEIFFRLEDARLRKWFGKSQREVLQGAGSIKRDCQIWEEFFLFHGYDYELVAPKNNKTKLDSKLFSNMTGWKERTNEHERDAAMLVYQL